MPLLYSQRILCLVIYILCNFFWTLSRLVQTWPLLALPLDCSGREESPVNIACAWPTCNHAIPRFFEESRGYSAWFHSLINSLDNLPADNSSKLPSELEFVSFFTLGIEYSAYDVRGECVYSVLPLENSFWKTAGVVIKRVGMQIVDCASPYLGVNLWPKLLKSIAVSFIPTSPKNFPEILPFSPLRIFQIPSLRHEEIAMILVNVVKMPT